MSAPAFVSETRERFLKAILAQLPIERIRELYLFQPIKQGGVESGVAVVAAWPEGRSDVDAQPEVQTTEQGLVVPVEEPPAVALEEVTGDVAETNSCELPAAQGEAAAADAEAPVAADVAPDGVESATPDARRPAPDEKYTVYSARYRHVLKGPDRGKWEASVVAEADAPLVSIETVVRGVQRRAGDVDAADHMTADDVRTALRLAPATPAPQAAGSDVS